MIHCGRLIATAATTPTTTTATAVAATTATATTVAATTATGTGTVFTRLGLVDLQGAPLDLGAVQSRDGLVAAFAHLDEAETARAAGFAVGSDLGAGDSTMRREPLAEVVGGGAEGKIPYVNVLAHLVLLEPRGLLCWQTDDHLGRPVGGHSGLSTGCGKAWRSRNCEAKVSLSR